MFGSGNSVADLGAEERAYLLKKCFVVTVNYAPIHLAGHLNMWADGRVSEFIAAHYAGRPKDRLFLARASERNRDMAGQIDYWFSPSAESLKGTYTVGWALQLMQRHFPEKRVLLFGFDGCVAPGAVAKWYDAHTDFDCRRRVKGYPVQRKLDQCARQLERYCRREGVFNCNPRSRLDYFEKREWQELLPLSIVHLAPSPLAGAPTHLSGSLNKYTRHRSTSVLRRDFSLNPPHHNLRWNYDHVNPSAEALGALVAGADVVHVHQRPDPAAAGARTLLQFHAEPAGYRPSHTHAAFNERKLVIAQYHPRFYTDAQIVPNLIDIWDEAFCPGEKPADRVRIFFSWATERKGGWGDKGADATQGILRRIEERYGGRVETVVMNNRPYAECLSAKRTAHICIDECVTGSYHLQSLEGCAVAAATFNAIDEQTVAALRAVTGTGEHPFVKSGLAGLFEALCHLIEHPDQLARQGQAARAWMEKYWDPRVLVRRFARAYYDVLLLGKIRPFVAPGEPLPREVMPAVAVAVPTPQISRAPFRADLLIGRPITELHRRHVGEEVFVFGTGPSLLSVNPEDFRDKLCIGINVAFEVVPHLRYVFTHSFEIYEAIKGVVSAERCVLPETLVQRPIANPHPGGGTRVPNAAAEAWVYRIQDPNERELARKTVSLAPDAELFTWSTAAHSAIHFAAFLGAAKITLIGMDYALHPRGRVHFESRHVPGYGAQRWHAFAKHRQGDEWLTAELAKQGVQVINRSGEFLAKARPPGETMAAGGARASISFAEIQAYCRGKRLAIVGNSSLLLEREDGARIDACDLVVRMNHGYPRASTLRATGSRTDIWVCSFNDRARQISERDLFKARYILRLQPDRAHLDPRLEPDVYVQEPIDYDELRRQLGGEFPSTGCMAIWFFLERVGALADVQLFGFDFFQRPNFDRVGRAPFHDVHNPEVERRFLTELVAKHAAVWVK